MDPPRASNITVSPARHKMCPLLMLPAELRNHIYDEVAKHDKALLTKDRAGHVYLTSPFCQLNRQLRREYRPVLATTASSVYSIVTDFNFDDILEYEKHAHNKCRHIGIRLTCSAKRAKNLLSLIRWTNYQNETTSPLTKDAYYFPHRAKSTKLGTHFYNKRLQRVWRQHLIAVIDFMDTPRTNHTNIYAITGKSIWELNRAFESVRYNKLKPHPSWEWH
jgi:hypothetical protein